MEYALEILTVYQGASMSVDWSVNTKKSAPIHITFAHPSLIKFEGLFFFVQNLSII